MSGKYRIEFNSNVADFIDVEMIANEYVKAVQEDAINFGENGYGMPNENVIVDIYIDDTNIWLSSCFWNGREIV